MTLGELWHNQYKFQANIVLSKFQMTFRKKEAMRVPNWEHLEHPAGSGDRGGCVSSQSTLLMEASIPIHISSCKCPGLGYPGALE